MTPESRPEQGEIEPVASGPAAAPGPKAMAVGEGAGMAGRGRWYLIGGGLALAGLVAGGAFVASRAGEPDASMSASASAGSPVPADADAASSGAAVSPGAAPAQGPAAAAASPATSRDWAAGTGAGPAAAGGAVAESGAPPTVLVEAVNLDPPVTVQVLSAKRVTPDTLRVELALVSRSAAPEALDLRGLTVAPASASSASAAGSTSGGVSSGSGGSAATGGQAGGHAAARPAAGGARHPLGLTDLCLVTADGGRRLFALRDDQGKPVGAGDFAPLAPNERRVLWAVFPAPPVADTQVTLLVGSVTLRNVPIS